MNRAGVKEKEGGHESHEIDNKFKISGGGGDLFIDLSGEHH